MTKTSKIRLLHLLEEYHDHLDDVKRQIRVYKDRPIKPSSFDIGMAQQLIPLLIANIKLLENRLEKMKQDCKTKVKNDQDR